MRGGYRPRAGRKQGFAAKSAEEARRLLSERVAQEIEPISDILISQAKKGDIRAIKELFDRAWGRAPQAIEITEPEEAPDTPEREAMSKRMSEWMREISYIELADKDPDAVLQQFRDWNKNGRAIAPKTTPLN